MKVVITGTPGTGKTSVAKALEKYKFKNYNLSKILKKCGAGVDKKRKVKIIDEKKFGKEINKVLRKNENIVVESHLSHYSNPKYVDLCVVLRTNPKILEKRLEKRGYSKEKIKENVEAEQIDLILVEALNKKFKVYEIDTTKRKAQSVAKEIVKALKEKKQSYGKINWADTI